MEFDILLLLLCAAALVQSAKLKETKPVEPTQKSAIIAIQIVDPDEESNGKNSKRGIESSLGYGYQSNIYHGKVSPPKFEIYKYSQHDIPPYQGSPSLKNNVGFQDSYQHNSQHSVQPQVQYQPGTTLFSTINQHGQVAMLSSQIPTNFPTQGNIAVPVIILKVLPSQLAQSSDHLYANIPQSNYLAPIVNSIDIKALLNQYLSNIATSPTYSSVQYQPEVPQYRQKQTYQYQSMPYQQSSQYYQQEQAPEQNYYYPSQNYQQEQEYEQQEQEYQSQEQEYRSQETSTTKYQGQQYLPTNSENSKNNKLLTYENYPAKTHTRVIFKTQEGHVKSPEQTQPDTYQEQQKYSKEPSQDLDYSQYSDQGVDYAQNSPDYSDQNSNQYSYGSEHKEAASENIIYVADSVDGGDDKEKVEEES